MRKITVLILVPAFGLFFWASAKPSYVTIKAENLAFTENSTKTDSISPSEKLELKNPPLVIIDGVESTMNEMADLDPNKIDSVDVLKDKSAIKVYGEKGKNGVILITTKNKENTL